MTAAQSPKDLDMRERRHRLRCRDDFEYYAAHNLSIRTKKGEIVPFRLNRAQKYIHDRIEDQRRRTGKVRAIILKGRQQGCSTYIEGRYFWRTTHRKGVRSFILAHESDSTSSLFSMAKRYFDNCPLPMRPSVKASNAKELIFDKLDSGYKIGTAGNDSVGRSQTNQYFHGSEVGFWTNTSELMKGVLQTVPDEDETEIIYESTANGVGNFFHQKCQEAMKGEGEYLFIFVPWFWQPEYTKHVPGGFERTEEEQELVDQYRLSDEQLQWRRVKIQELSTGGENGLKAFRQEYPNNANEAFQVTGEDGYILPDCVVKARNTTVKRKGALIVGVDPSRGGDRFAVARRQGRTLWGVEGFTGDIDLGRQVQICTKILKEEKPTKMFIDMGGGDALVDRLRELGHGRVVRGIYFGGKPLNPEKYKNKRMEMVGELKDWLNDEHMPVDIPDDDALQSDYCIPRARRDSMDRFVLESKDDIRGRVGFSTDYLDASALTFAEPVRDPNSEVFNHKRNLRAYE